MFEFEIIKGKLKQVSHEWQKYLLGKTLILCSGLGDTYNLAGIEGEEDLEELCKFVWEVETEHDYEKLEHFIEEVKLTNDGFGFYLEEIEIIESLCVEVGK